MIKGAKCRMYGFEFDKNKSASNFNKHGIDVVEAQKLWYDPDLVEIQAKCDNEPRFLLVAKIKEKHWSAIITYRKDKIRIISVRCSRKLEVELYEA